MRRAPVAWLWHTLRLSSGAAKRQALLAQRLDTGQCSATRAALAAGCIDPDQAAVITRVVAELPAGTTSLVRQATGSGWPPNKPATLSAP